MTDVDVWTIRSTLDWVQGYLDRHDDPNPKLSAQILIGEACSLERVELFMNLDKPLTIDERTVLREYVTRRGAGEPLQYITGKAPFRYLSMKVKPGVLIPRPETEVLVSEVLKRLPDRPKIRCAEYILDSSFGQSVGDGHEEDQDEIEDFDSGSFEPIEKDSILVADLCTGTGCIACSLASEHELVHVIATDISDNAVRLAKDNIANLDLKDRIDVIECDLFDDIDPDLLGQFVCIVSNPPYVPSSVCASLNDEVKEFEPMLALDGGTDGLDVFRRISKWSIDALDPNGFLAVELFEESLEDAKEIALSDGFESVEIIKDLANRPRCLICSKGKSYE